jgi:hypothetical protein
MSTSPEVTSLTIPAVTPNPELVLLDSKFLSALKAVEKQVHDLHVHDAATAQLAANLQVRLTDAGGALEKARVALKAPFIAKGKEIDEVAKAPAIRIQKAKDTLKSQLVTFEFREEQKRQEAERARLAEIARLEKLAADEAAAAKAKAAEIARLAAEEAAKSNVPTMDVDFGDDTPAEPPPKTETEKQLDAVKHTPVPVTAAPVGVRYKTVLIPTLVDINRVPEAFVIKTVNMQEIRKLYVTGYKEGDPLPEVDGIKFETKREVTSSGGRAI